ncbi:hypothetical protein ONZ45_g14349 [Pleurotus djamor]|nr:hypothetical protein ONZ45_g14349 [Pleurotus djamor]
MSSTSKLPPELFSVIASHISNNDTLIRCAITSRAWVLPSQQCLFHHLDLIMDGEFTSAGANRLNRLCRCLDSSPHLIPYIHSLRIIFFDESILWNGALTTQQDQLIAILSRLPQLAAFSIIAASGLRMESAIPPHLREVISKTIHSSIKHLSLFCLDFDESSTFISLLGPEFPKLRSLSLEYIDVNSVSAMEAFRGDSIIELDSLALTERKTSPLGTLLSGLTFHVRCLSLTWGRGTFNDACSFVVSSSVEELNLSPTLPASLTGNLQHFSKLRKLAFPFRSVQDISLLETLPPHNQIEFMVVGINPLFPLPSDAWSQLDQILASSLFLRLRKVALRHDGVSQGPRRSTSVLSSDDLPLSLARGILFVEAPLCHS